MKNQTAAKLDAFQAEVDALKRLQAETTVKDTGQAVPELDALLSQTVKIDTSPWILSPFEAERKPGILDRAFIRLHPVSAGQEGEL